MALPMRMEGTVEKIIIFGPRLDILVFLVFLILLSLPV